MDGDKKKILFLSLDNSCRTQMAEAWVRHLKSDCLIPYSAGVEPQAVNLKAVKVMNEVGIDISRQSSKNVYDLHVIFDYIFYVGANAVESVPLFPGSASITFLSYANPKQMAAACETEEEKLNCYRSVRNQIKKLVKTFPEALKKH
jgi:arsenate reductase